MTIFTKQTIVQSFPAYVIAEREADHSGFVQITAGDRLGVDSGKGFFNEYQAGSVASYALERNECPMEAIERAKRLGHELHWISACSVALTSHKQDQRTLVKVAPGMRVCFEGLRATIEKAPNNNLRFVRIQDAK